MANQQRQLLRIYAQKLKKLTTQILCHCISAPQSPLECSVDGQFLSTVSHC